MIFDFKKEASVFSKLKKSDLSAFENEIKELKDLFGTLIVNENTIEPLYFLYLSLDAETTFFGFSIVDGQLIEKQKGCLVPFFQDFIDGGYFFPKRKKAAETFVRLCDMNIGNQRLSNLLKTNILEDYHLDRIRQLTEFRKLNLKTFIDIHDKYPLDLKTAEGKRLSHILFNILRTMDAGKIDEFTVEDLFFFMDKILPLFVQRLSTQITATEIFANTNRLLDWFLVWRNHLHRSEAEPPGSDEYYNTDFTTIIQYVTEYLWWNNGFKYRKKDKVFTFGSQGFYFLAKGGSTRKVPNHPSFTRRMAREFVGLSYNLNLGEHEDMYIYLYAKSLGGGHRLSSLLMEYINHPDHEVNLKNNLEKWNPVIQKLSSDDFEELNAESAKAFLGYLYHCLRDKPLFTVQLRNFHDLKRESDEYYDRIARRNGERHQRAGARLNAQRPDRALEEMVQVRNQHHGGWRQLAAAAQSRKPLQWKRHTSIHPFIFKTKKGKNSSRAFQIVELRNELELKKEGVAMRHCVGGYARKCFNNDCTIWSMRRLEGGKFYRMVTIEISRSKVIVQMRGKMNSNPGAEERDLIKSWASKQGVKVDD